MEGFKDYRVADIPADDMQAVKEIEQKLKQKINRDIVFVGYEKNSGSYENHARHIQSLPGQGKEMNQDTITEFQEP